MQYGSLVPVLEVTDKKKGGGEVKLNKYIF